MGNGVVTTFGRDRRAAWYSGFALYAAGVALFSGPGLDHWWGTWAAGGYAVAAVVTVAGSGRDWGRGLAIAASLAGALAAPALWLMTREPTPPDVAVVARSGVLLLHHGSPYLPLAALSAGGWLAYNPYLPVMALFGLPGALDLPGKTWPWLIAGTFLLLYATFRVMLGPRGAGRRRDALDQAAFWLACPVMAFPLTMGITDPPVIALTCLALALLARGRRPLARSGRHSEPVLATSPATADLQRPPRETYSAPRAPSRGSAPARGLRRLVEGLPFLWGRDSPMREGVTGGVVPPGGETAAAAVVLGVACAMKYTAWPALAIIAVMVVTRNGVRSAVRFTAIALASAVALVVALAPAALRHPASILRNTVAYPLGLTAARSPAQSPLPGHLISTLGSGGHLAALVLLAVAGLATIASLVRFPPVRPAAAARRIAIGLTALFLLSPATRFGYFIYPIALYWWAVIADRQGADRRHGSTIELGLPDAADECRGPGKAGLEDGQRSAAQLV